MFGVEPICRVLSEHGVPIAPSTYYEARSRRPSKRAVRDAEITALIPQPGSTGSCVGARKMWLHLRRNCHDEARCTVERLMIQHGWTGARRGKQPLTTSPHVRQARSGSRQGLARASAASGIRGSPKDKPQVTSWQRRCDKGDADDATLLVQHGAMYRRVCSFGIARAAGLRV